MTSIQITNRLEKIQQDILHNRYSKSQLEDTFNIFSKTYDLEVKHWFTNIYMEEVDSTMVFEVYEHTMFIDFIKDKQDNFYVTKVVIDYL